MEDSITEAVLRAAGENAKTVTTLEDGVSALKSAISSQEERIVGIQETVARGVAALGGLSSDADRAAEAIDAAATSAQRGMGRVETLASDVGIMAGQVSSSGRFLGELAETIDEIVKTAAAIKETAEDLAVISINTAIEAARAGEKGRGFAVIAREVRKLADRSGELSELIGRSVGDAGAKLGGVRGAVSSAAESSRSAAEASRSFARDFSAIVDASSRAKELVDGFAIVARERLEAERAIEGQVRGIASEGRIVIERGDVAASLASALRVSTERTLASISGVKTDRHDRALRQAERLAVALSSIDLRSRDALGATLRAAFSASAAFELLYVMDERGLQVSDNVVNPLCAGKISSAGYGADRSAKEYFSVPAGTSRPYLSPAYLSSASGSLCITAAIPLTDRTGALRGVLAADFDATGLSGASCADV